MGVFSRPVNGGFDDGWPYSSDLYHESRRRLSVCDRGVDCVMNGRFTAWLAAGLVGVGPSVV
jgi:hypothetical protein